jgi:hypothetical protein
MDEQYEVLKEFEAMFCEKIEEREGTSRTWEEAAEENRGCVY